MYVVLLAWNSEILLSSAGIIDVCHMSCAIKGSTLWLLFVVLALYSVSWGHYSVK